MNVRAAQPFVAGRWNGHKIDQPGVYSGVDMGTYHSGCLCDAPSVTSSVLRKVFIKSPAHAWATSPLNPDRTDEQDKAAFTLGRAAHHLLLGEDNFSTFFVMRPERIDGEPWHGNRKACKAWLAEQSEEGRTVLTPDQIGSIRGMARSLSNNALVITGALNGSIEQTIAAKDKKTGLWLLSRPDAIPNDSGDFCDLKTTASIGFDLDRAIAKYRYDMQAALVRRTYREVTGRKMESFSFVFVESAPPYSVDVLTMRDGDLEEAEKDLDVALRVFAKCLKAGSWFGPMGTQNDARYAHLSDKFREDATARREFLEKELA